jgi:hypothetical protein
MPACAATTRARRLSDEPPDDARTERDGLAAAHVPSGRSGSPVPFADVSWAQRNQHEQLKQRRLRAGPVPPLGRARRRVVLQPISRQGPLAENTAKKQRIESICEDTARRGRLRECYRNAAAATERGVNFFANRTPYGMPSYPRSSKLFES